MDFQLFQPKLDKGSLIAVCCEDSGEKDRFYDDLINFHTTLNCLQEITDLKPKKKLLFSKDKMSIMDLMLQSFSKSDHKQIISKIEHYAKILNLESNVLLRIPKALSTSQFNRCCSILRYLKKDLPIILNIRDGFKIDDFLGALRFHQEINAPTLSNSPIIILVQMSADELEQRLYELQDISDQDPLFSHYSKPLYELFDELYLLNDDHLEKIS